MSDHHDHSRQQTNAEKKGDEQEPETNKEEQQSRSASRQSQDSGGKNTTTAQSREGSRTATPEARQNHDDVTFEPVDPENFDTKSFFTDIDALSQKLHSDSLVTFDGEYDEKELGSMVSAVTVSMENFKNYTMHSQAHLERLRGQIKEVKDKMQRKIASHPYDASGERMSYEERELDAKLQKLNKELARASEDLARAEEVSAQTEVAATEAALTAESAAEEAKKIQEEYEARKKVEAEKRQKEQERKAKEEKEQQEQLRLEEEHRKAEDARKAKLRKDQVAVPDWEKWPVFTYRIKQGDFDQGIGCIVRGNANSFRENMISCELVDNMDCYILSGNEELVSNVIDVKGDAHFENQAYILIPHCTSRASAMTREPIIKAETSNGWVDLKSQEISLDGYKDLKFVQAELTDCSKMAVVTRYKRDYLTFPKKGGSLHSSVDQRVTLTAPRGCFTTKEHFVIQLQPVDATTIHEVKQKSEAGQELLATSAFMSTEWTAREFGTPITVAIPVPPNPVKAKKAAAARAAKEAKMKNPNKFVPPPDEDEHQKKKEKQQRNKNTRRTAAAAAQAVEEEDSVVTKKPTKWYMGQYGAQEEDEHDVLFLTYKDQKGKWHVTENKSINPIRLDMVELQLQDPHLIDKFLVLRMKTTAEASGGLQLAKELEARLTERTVNFILKQNKENPYDVVAEVVQPNKVEKILDKLEKEGFTEGPDVSKEITLKEGEHIGIAFRANVKATDEGAGLDVRFNSQLQNRMQFELCEVDKYLQKSYHMYRGYVQLVKKTAMLCVMPPKKDKKKGTKKADNEEKGTEEEKEEKHDLDETKKNFVQHEKEVLCELQVSIPKEQEQLEPVTLNKAHVTLRSRSDVINDETLRTLSRELGEEWKKLAAQLNIKKMRIQAILRNNMASENTEEDAKFDMLVTWAKRVPKGMSKVDILKTALRYSGREDLAEDLAELEENFHREQKGLNQA